ncbi:MAG: hypothetical protein GX323_04075 [Clostridiales bacterium]|nr:hypothetical protein [Clostridiales bacterium]
MDSDRVILCGSSAYEKRYYFNEVFSSLPDAVKEELQIMCVLYTEEVGGVLTLEFDAYGNLLLQVSAREDDLLFDEIGSHLKIKDIRIKRKDLLEGLETYFKVFYLGQAFEDLKEYEDEDEYL